MSVSDSAKELNLLKQVEGGPAEWAVALIWFRSRSVSGLLMTAGEICSALHDHGFVGDLNPGGFARTLDTRPELLRSKSSTGFRINAAKSAELDQRFGLLAGDFRPVPTSPMFDSSIAGSRKYLKELLDEANLCHNATAFDGFAVVVRRVVEGLLISLYEAEGQRAAIERGGHTLLLADLLGVVRGQQPLRFSRGFDKQLEIVKDIGDRAAHHRYHLTTSQEASQIAAAAKILMAELLGRLAMVDAAKS